MTVTYKQLKGEKIEEKSRCLTLSRVSRGEEICVIVSGAFVQKYYRFNSPPTIQTFHSTSKLKKLRISI